VCVCVCVCVWYSVLLHSPGWPQTALGPVFPMWPHWNLSSFSSFTCSFSAYFFWDKRLETSHLGPPGVGLLLWDSSNSINIWNHIYWVRVRYPGEQTFGSLKNYIHFAIPLHDCFIAVSVKNICSLSWPPLILLMPHKIWTWNINILCHYVVITQKMEYG
jgi:hypothetical protein